MKETIMDPQFLLSLFFYLLFLILFYFKGLKGDGSNITVYITIILYIFNIAWIYNHKGLFKNNNVVLFQVILFYFLNIILLYTYFDPFNKAMGLDPSKNKMDITDYKPIIFSLSSVLGFISIIVYALLQNTDYSSSNINRYLLMFLKICGSLVILIGIISLFFYFAVYTPLPITIITSILNIGIFIVTLSLLYNFFLKKHLNTPSKSPFMNLIKAYILYFPCLFIDFINYLKKELKLTTKTEWLILLMDIMIIGLRFLIPYLYKLYYKHLVVDGDMIEKGPIYLNKKHNLGVVQDHEPSIKMIGKELIVKPYNYNYAISAQIWINPQPPSTSNSYNKSTSILDYGEVLKINFNKNNLEFFAATTEDGEISEALVKIYETEVFYYQKWNSIILNYSGGTLDIFINNILVSSSINITPIIKFNSVIAGSTNGIHGGIKNIMYYNKILDRSAITSISNKE